MECVKRLLANVNDAHNIVAVVRDPKKYEGAFPQHARLNLVAGDVTDKGSLQKALQGCQYVINAASGKGYFSSRSVDNEGVANVAEVAKQAGAEQVVLVSSMLVTPKNRWNPIRLLLNNIRWGLMDEKFNGEEALRRSGMPYTVVRPAGLKNTPPQQDEIVAAQGDTGTVSGSISRADVAAVCVAALGNPAAQNVTVEVMTRKDQPASNRWADRAEYNKMLQQIFSDLKKD